MIPWSYSFLNDLANCPHKAWRKYVKRDLPKEDLPALREGITTHELLEKHINSKGATRLPVALEPFAAPLVRAGALAEVKLGMTKNLVSAGFWDEPWGRGKVDVLILEPPTALIVDWKTGKVREDDRELRTLAMLVRANYPEITKIYGYYVWLKEGKVGKEYDLSDINRTYHGTVASMAEAESYGDDWPCTPNALCAYCPVADCRFNSRIAT